MVPLFKRLAFILILCLCATGVAAQSFNPAVLWPEGDFNEKHPFALRVYNGVSLFEKYQKAPVKKFRGPDKRRSPESILATAASQSHNPIFTFGYSYGEALTKVAAQYPEIQFFAVDGITSKGAPENITVVQFANEEGAFLMGVLAAYVSQSKEIGFLGGMDVTAIRDFACGYILGARSVEPDIIILVDMVGDTGAAFNNPKRAKLLAEKQFNDGADVIFHAAGGSGVGVFEAAEKTNNYAIGVDSNQNSIKPGRIVSSLLKRIDIVTYNLLKNTLDGHKVHKSMNVGLKQGAMDWVIDQHNLDFIQTNVKHAIDRAKTEIVSGVTIVPKAREVRQCDAFFRSSDT